MVLKSLNKIICQQAASICAASQTRDFERRVAGIEWCSYLTTYYRARLHRGRVHQILIPELCLSRPLTKCIPFCHYATISFISSSTARLAHHIDHHLALLDPQLDCQSRRCPLFHRIVHRSLNHSHPATVPHSPDTGHLPA